MFHIPIVILFFIFTTFFLEAKDASPCYVSDSYPAELAEIVDITEEGKVILKNGTILIIANINWPDVLEPKYRQEIRQKLIGYLQGQKIFWKVSLPENRWGEKPAQLFLQENKTNFPPFWLQAGIAEAGLLPIWPDQLSKECWNKLRYHEKKAVFEKKGYWAPHRQTERNRRINKDPKDYIGKKIVGIWQIQNIHSWHNLNFVNFTKAFKKGSSITLSSSQVKMLNNKGKNIGKDDKIIIRAIIGNYGTMRMRITKEEDIEILR